MGRKYNVYEKEILLPLKISKIMFVIYVALNLALPLYTDGAKGYQSIYSYLYCFFMLLGVLGMHGYFKPIAPLLPMMIVRIIQFALAYIYKPPMIIPLAIIFALVDIGVNIFFMTDRAIYEQITEKEEWVWL